jgi:hypothetical protein
MLNGPDSKCTRRDWLRLAGLSDFGLSLSGLLRAGTSSRQEPAAERATIVFQITGTGCANHGRAIPGVFADSATWDRLRMTASLRTDRWTFGDQKFPPR